jgi:hypothetical protein
VTEPDIGDLSIGPSVGSHFAAGAPADKVRPQQRLHSITSLERASSSGGTVKAERLSGFVVDNRLDLSS